MIRLNQDLVIVVHNSTRTVFEGYFFSHSRFGLMAKLKNKDGVECIASIDTLINGGYTVTVKGK
jgi:hypothetical protein